MQIISKFGKKSEERLEKYSFWVEHRKEDYRCEIKLDDLEDYVTNDDRESKRLKKIEEKCFLMIEGKINNKDYQVMSEGYKLIRLTEF